LTMADLLTRKKLLMHVRAAPRYPVLFSLKLIHTKSGSRRLLSQSIRSQHIAGTGEGFLGLG
jgi:hypothetical protein